MSSQLEAARAKAADRNRSWEEIRTEMVAEIEESTQRTRLTDALKNPESQLSALLGERPRTLDQAVEILVGSALELLFKKRADYGTGNIAKHGEYGVLVRADDKLERLRTLLTPGAKPPNFEAIEDTWRDLFNYALIAQLVRHGWWELELEGARDGQDSTVRGLPVREPLQSNGADHGDPGIADAGQPAPVELPTMSSAGIQEGQ